MFGICFINPWGFFEGEVFHVAGVFDFLSIEQVFNFDIAFENIKVIPIVKVFME
jgi:hypothetical protein